jgi:hypothetical protein
MSYAPNPEGLRSAFAAERFTFDETSVQFSLAEAGRLAVSDGKIAAGDAQADPAPAPFTQCVPNGDYPVALALARFANGEERIAYARVLLDGAPAAHWYPALTADQDARMLKEGDIFGYVVVSGTACFASGASRVEFSVGGGSYPSYFAYDASGRVTALVTDFAVVPGIRDLPGPRRSWWNRILFFWR